MSIISQFYEISNLILYKFPCRQFNNIYIYEKYTNIS